MTRCIACATVATFMEYFSLLAYLALGFGCGLIASISGGAALISIPGLILLGLTPQTAIATNKFAALAMNTSGTIGFHKGGKIDYPIAIQSTFFAMFGAYFGAQTLLMVPEGILNNIVAACLFIVLMVIVFKKDIGMHEHGSLKKWSKCWGAFAFFAIGFWGSFFGGGFAIMAVYAYIFLYGQTFEQSAGEKMLLGIGIAAVSIVVYGLNGVIDWLAGAFLIPGMVLGAYLGAKIAMEKGNHFIRGTFIIMVSAACVKLLF